MNCPWNERFSIPAGYRLMEIVGKTYGPYGPGGPASIQGQYDHCVVLLYGKPGEPRQHWLPVWIEGGLGQ